MSNVSTMAEVKEIYHEMSLLELLAEENLMAQSWVGMQLDSDKEAVLKMLRSEIVKRLR